MFLIYGKPGCSFCVSAKELLSSKEKPYTYLTLGEDYTKEELIEVCSPVIPRTLPQVFFLENGDLEHIGGFTELKSFIG